MNPKHKFLRVVLAATLGAILWAGCASHHPTRTASGQPLKVVCLDMQEDLSHMHPDTHPEWRLGMNMAFPNPPLAHWQIENLSTAVDQPML